MLSSVLIIYRSSNSKLRPTDKLACFISPMLFFSNGSSNGRRSMDTLLITARFYNCKLYLFLNSIIVQIQTFFSLIMNDKAKLIDSMANLIHHVSSSRKNQEEIYATLSLADLNKILDNLEDSNEKLRKTTLHLIAELLYDNVKLQKSFCESLQIPYLPGKITLTKGFPRIISIDKQSITEVTKALKQHDKQKGLFWFIDSLTKPKFIQVGRRNTWIDPLSCIVGVWIDTEKIGGQLRDIQPVKKQYESIIGPPTRRIQINPLNGKIKLNKTQFIQKTYQFQQRPSAQVKVVEKERGSLQLKNNQKQIVFPNNNIITNKYEFKISSSSTNPSIRMVNSDRKCSQTTESNLQLQMMSNTTRYNSYGAQKPVTYTQRYEGYEGGRSFEYSLTADNSTYGSVRNSLQLNNIKEPEYLIYKRSQLNNK